MVNVRIAAAAVLVIGICLWAGLTSIGKAEIPSEFPEGTATPSEVCGACHSAIYREYALGFGADMKFPEITYSQGHDTLLRLPAAASTTGSAHSLAGIDPFPNHARESEEDGKHCNVCHFPLAFDIPDNESMEISKPMGRGDSLEAGGLTCASCHLTPSGVIRGVHAVSAPHSTIVDSNMQRSAMCAYCHAKGKRVIGKQTQTFLEWREDFARPGLGRQQCQDCHMPRTLRQSADEAEGPLRAVGRHLWTGGHSNQRLTSALSLVIVHPQKGKRDVQIHVINIGAGHSVPTGSNRRAVYLQATVLNEYGSVVLTRNWMFAAWYGDRPDDSSFLAEDRKRPDSIAAIQADAQGPHESSIRAGEERVLTWSPDLKPGKYTVHVALVYDLNRYNAMTLTNDQTVISSNELTLDI